MFKNTSNSNIMKFQNYLVKDGQAVPENPFDYRPVKDVNYQNIDWLVFETWKQSHTYATNAPDGSWPVERFDIVWQYRSEVQDWIDVSLVRYDEYATFEAYSKESSKWYRVETRQFAKFKEEVEKPKESMKTGIELIADERQEQIKKHGYTVDRDQQYNDPNSHGTLGKLAYAAMHALWPEGQFYPLGWANWFRDKISKKSYKERLIISGALIAAELDRINNIPKEI